MSMGNRFSVMEIQAFVNQLYGGRPVIIVPYGYTLTFSNITAGASLTQVLSITANADFILTQIKARTSDATAQTVSNKNAPYFRVLIVDSGSNEQYTNSPADIECYATNGNTAQGLLPYPRFISGRTSLSVTLSSYTAIVSTQSTDLYLEGVLCRTFSA
jgi:hypothetical protein